MFKSPLYAFSTLKTSWEHHRNIRIPSQNSRVKTQSPLTQYPIFAEKKTALKSTFKSTFFSIQTAKGKALGILNKTRQHRGQLQIWFIPVFLFSPFFFSTLAISSLNFLSAHGINKKEIKIKEKKLLAFWKRCQGFFPADHFHILFQDIWSGILDSTNL